jgi:hypothetical protein
MKRIKIKDLPKDARITKEEMRRVMGGFNPQPEPPGKLFEYKIQSPFLMKI